MATTTNYSWSTPDDTALVKDGAAAIRTLGSSIDTTTKALNPSTTLGDIEYRSSTANTNTRLGIGSTGNVLTVAGGVPTWAAPASPTLTFSGASIYKSADQSISNSSQTKITFDTERFDTDAYHSLVSNTERFTIPAGKDGKYSFSAGIQYAQNSTGNYRILSIYKNGSTQKFATLLLPVNAPNMALNMTVIDDAVAGDYYEVAGFQDSGGSLNVRGSEATWFMITYLGA